MEKLLVVDPIHSASLFSVTRIAAVWRTVWAFNKWLYAVTRIQVNVPTSIPVVARIPDQESLVVSLQ